MNQVGPGFNLFAVNPTQEKQTANVDDEKIVADQGDKEEVVTEDKIVVNKTKKSTTPKSEKKKTAKAEKDDLPKTTEKKNTSGNTKKKTVTRQVQPAIDAAKTQPAASVSERQRKMDEGNTSKHSNNSLILFFIFAIIAWILGYCSDFTTIGTWSISIISGLYFMQLKKLFTGRPWLDGGAIIGVVIFVLQCFFSDSSIGEVYLMSLMLTIIITICWWVLVKVLKN